MRPDPPGTQLRPLTAGASSFLLNVHRAPAVAARGGHPARQSPGDIRQLGRVRGAGGRFPGRPFRQASSGAPAVRPSAACRAVGLREECHLLPSDVSAGTLWGGVRLGGPPGAPRPASAWLPVVLEPLRHGWSLKPLQSGHSIPEPFVRKYVWGTYCVPGTCCVAGPRQ